MSLLRLMLLACAVVFAQSAQTADVLRVAGEPAPGDAKAMATRALRMPAFPAAAVHEWRIPALPAQRIQQLREANSQPGVKRLQIGIERGLAEAGLGRGVPQWQWQVGADGSQVARLALTSAGAAGLRLAFEVLAIPDAAELRFLGERDARSVIPMVSGAELSAAHREQQLWWGPVTEGPRQVVELWLPPGADAAALQLRVDRISDLIVSPYGDLSGAKIGESDSCEIDVDCVSNPSTAYLNAKNAVARMVFQLSGGSSLCTGTLLVDTVTSSSIPYFYSANHCFSSQSVASTLVTMWNYEATACGSGVLDSVVQVGGGATLLFNSSSRDVLFLRLNNAAPAGSFFSGWDANAVSAGNNILVIHHPKGDVKKVSQGQVKGFADYGNPTGVGTEFINVGYTVASTEQGSSGSGLLTFANSQYFFRGGLYGGSAGCSNTGSISTPGNDDYFSRFDQVFSNISQFLAPAPASSFAISSGLKGTWVTPGSSGQGWILDIDPASTLFVAGWYTATSSGSSLDWFTGVGNFSGASVNLQILRNSATIRFATPGDGAPTPVGTGTMTFTSCTAGSFTYNMSDGRSGTLAMARLTPVPSGCQ